MLNFFLFLIMSISFLSAAPSEVFKALMNRPTTMLDFGMYKLERNLENSSIGNLSQEYSVSHYVTYDWENDKLLVFRNMITYNDKKTINKLLCKRNLNRFRKAFYVDNPGKTKNYFYLYNFRHNGFQKGNDKEQPEYNKIPSRTILQVNIHSSSFSKSVSCKSILISDEILIIE